MIPSRSPSASSSAIPSASPVSSTVWCGPVSRSPLTATSRSSAPCLATASSRWSKKPIPVARSPAPDPSRSRLRRTSVSPVVRWICELRLMRDAPSTRRARESPRLGPEPLPRARDAPPPRRARIREPSGAGRWRATGRSGSAPRRRSAARGSSRRRSRRRRSPPGRRRTGSPRAESSLRTPLHARRPARGAPARSAPPVTTASSSDATATWSTASVTLGRSTPSSSIGVHDPLAQAAVRRQQPEQAVRAVLGLREQVERHRRRIDVLAIGDHQQLARPGEPVDADARPRQLALGFLHVRCCPARRSHRRRA